MEKGSLSFGSRVQKQRVDGCGLNWDELEAIRKHHVRNRSRLASAARQVIEKLMLVDRIYSIRWRIKDPDRLVQKIIRRALQDPGLRIGLDNYQEIITDLAGIRAIHLFRDDWVFIHRFIVSAWDLKEKPVANVCRWDDEKYLGLFRKEGCRIHRHPFGYRSVHYLVSPRSSREGTFAVEIQVRTILEEAWCEIDHQVRYPDGDAPPEISSYLALLNRLLGKADEIGSLIRALKREDLPRNGRSGAGGSGMDAVVDFQARRMAGGHGEI